MPVQVFGSPSFDDVFAPVNGEPADAGDLQADPIQDLVNRTEYLNARLVVIPYLLGEAIYNGESINLGGQLSTPNAVTFNDTGSKIFIVGVFSETVFAYDLGTNFDVSTSVYNGENFDVSGQESSPAGVTFNDTGSKMFIVGIDADTVFAYDLGTNFDVSTSVYNGENFDVSGQMNAPAGVVFNVTGSKMFVVGANAATVFAYDLGTNFDVSTSVYNGESFDVSGQENAPNAVTFDNTGSRMFVVGTSTATVYDYDLGTNFDVSTSVYNGESFDVSGQESQPAGVTFDNCGTKIFIVGTVSDTVYAYYTNKIVATCI